MNSLQPWVPEFTLGHSYKVQRCSEVLRRKISLAPIIYNSMRKKKWLCRGNNLTVYYNCHSKETFEVGYFLNEFFSILS
jgi:hypothetical protein